MKERVRLVWEKAPKKGNIEVVYGKLDSIKIDEGKGACKKDGSFEFTSEEGALEVVVSDINIEAGSFPTIVRARTDINPFSFFLRDAMSSQYPVWIPEYGVTILPHSDKRSYHEVASEITSRKNMSDFTRFENEPEETFENASSKNRVQYSPTWLGISRDMRFFRFGYQEGWKHFGTITSDDRRPDFCSRARRFLSL
jgi:hypothetical protein